jgi:NAD(P)-dependent dehydrogenase (short-subunit alcohol dehydrogenase family)
VGTSQAIGPVWEVDGESLWRDVEVCLRGSFLWCRTVLPSMIARRRGRIVNLASAADFLPLPMTSGYACAKAGVVRLTDSLTASVKDFGISVFAIAPGPTAMR